MTEKIKPCISLTFDDGWKCQYDNALPILNTYRFKATFYIITQYLFHSHWMYMDRKTISELHTQGHEIAAHSVSHPNFYYTFPWKGQQIRKSKFDLNTSGISPESFAYPYGRQNYLVRRIVRKAHFSNARAIGDGFNDKKCDPFKIKGVYVKKDTSVAEVREWIENAKLNGYLLVLVFHQVDHATPAYGCSPDVLNDICNIIRNENISVLPLTAAVKFIKS